MAELTIEWKCPKCSAPADKHGKGGAEKCKERRHERSQCQGFLCMCDYDSDSDSATHGTSFTEPCPDATCFHCGWSGTFPVKPKNLQTWEKKALDAGWAPPAERKKELGL